MIERPLKLFAGGGGGEIAERSLSSDRSQVDRETCGQASTRLWQGEDLMHQQRRIHLGGSIVVTIVVLFLLLVGGSGNFQPTIATVTHELIRMSEMRTQLAEAKLSALKHYLNFSH
jgi:hypothetical protein